MIDLLLGAAFIIVVCGAICFVSYRFASRPRGNSYAAFVVAIAAATVLFSLSIHGRLVLAQIMPVSSVIIVGNWIPIGVAAIGGALLGRATLPLWRRCILFGCLIALAVYALIQPILGTDQTANNSWTSDGVLLQTSSVSCSACAAATLLNHHGIDSNETEMTRLCLTGSSGTPTLGLYRGLKLKTKEAPFGVVAFRSNVDELLANDKWQVLLLVSLEKGTDADPRYEREWGWTPGLGHAVVVLGRVGPDRIDVGDPSVGREQWTVDDLRVLWHGDGLKLVGH